MPATCASAAPNACATAFSLAGAVPLLRGAALALCGFGSLSHSLTLLLTPPLRTLCEAAAALRLGVQPQSQPQQGSLYKDALRSALRDTLLHDYCSTVHACLRDGGTSSNTDTTRLNTLPTALLSAALQEYESILPEFVALLSRLDTERVCGVHVLEHLYELELSGIPGVRQYAQRVRQTRVDGVLLRQIAAWISDGLLIDPHDEFWVQHNQAAEQSWTSAFTLRLSMLPSDSYRSTSSLASSVLFIGKAVRVLVQSDAAPDTDAISARVQSLAVDTADRTALHDLIEQIRVEVAQRLSHIVVVKGELLRHLRHLKDFFFLSNGAFYEEFIIESQALMQLAPTKRAETDINDSAFQLAASKFGLDLCPLFSQLRLTLPATSLHVALGDNSRCRSSVVCCGGAKFCSGVEGVPTAAAAAHGWVSLGSTAPSLAACALWSRSRCVIDDGFSYSLVLSCVDHSFSFGVVLQNERLEALGDGAEGLDGISPALALLLSSELDAVGARRRVTRLRLVQGGSHPLLLHSCVCDVDLGNGDQHRVSLHWRPLAQPSGHVQVEVDGSTAMQLEEKETATVVLRSFRLLGRRVYVGATAAHTTPVHLRTLSFDEHTTLDSSSSANALWRRLSLRYAVPSPLHLVLRDHELDRYADVFTFLLRVKRVHFGLRQAWLCTVKQEQRQQRQQQRQRLLRAKMQFLIDNLQFYLHVDVVEVQFALLQDCIGRSHDFESVLLAHDKYLAALAQHCFLHTRVITRAFEHVFDVCTHFCDLLASASTISDAQLDALNSDFERESCFLFTILSKKTSVHSSPHLAQLVLRINYNHFFSDASHRLGL